MKIKLVGGESGGHVPSFYNSSYAHGQTGEIIPPVTHNVTEKK